MPPDPNAAPEPDDQGPAFRPAPPPRTGSRLPRLIAIGLGLAGAAALGLQALPRPRLECRDGTLIPEDGEVERPLPPLPVPPPLCRNVTAPDPAALTAQYVAVALASVDMALQSGDLRRLESALATTTMLQRVAPDVDPQGVSGRRRDVLAALGQGLSRRSEEDHGRAQTYLREARQAGAAVEPAPGAPAVSPTQPKQTPAPTGRAL